MTKRPPIVTGQRPPTYERRRAPRRQPVTARGAPTVRLRPGGRATLVDASSVGLGLELTARLRAGTAVVASMPDVDHGESVTGRLVRGHVAALGPQGVHYRYGFEGSVPRALLRAIATHDE